MGISPTPVQGYVRRLTGIIWKEDLSFTEYHLNRILSRMCGPPSITRRGLSFKDHTKEQNRGEEGRRQKEQKKAKRQTDRLGQVDH